MLPLPAELLHATSLLGLIDPDAIFGALLSALDSLGVHPTTMTQTYRALILVADQYRLSHHRQPLQHQAAKPRRSRRQKIAPVSEDLELTQSDSQEEEVDPRASPRLDSAAEESGQEESAILLDSAEANDDNFDDFEAELTQLVQDSQRSPEDGLEGLKKFLGLQGDSSDPEAFQLSSDDEDSESDLAGGWDFA